MASRLQGPRKLDYRGSDGKLALNSGGMEGADGKAGKGRGRGDCSRLLLVPKPPCPYGAGDQVHWPRLIRGQSISLVGGIRGHNTGLRVEGGMCVVRSEFRRPVGPYSLF